jgi:hypothetical protein
MNAEELASQITGRYLLAEEALEEIRKWVGSSYDFQIELDDLKRCISNATRPNNFESMIREFISTKRPPGIPEI